MPQARLVHNRSRVNRARSHWLRVHAESSYYLSERHLKKQITERLCFAWLKTGYGLAATLPVQKIGLLKANEPFGPACWPERPTRILTTLSPNLANRREPSRSICASSARAIDRRRHWRSLPDR